MAKYTQLFKKRKYGSHKGSRYGRAARRHYFSGTSHRLGKWALGKVAKRFPKYGRRAVQAYGYASKALDVIADANWLYGNVLNPAYRYIKADYDKYTRGKTPITGWQNKVFYERTPKYLDATRRDEDTITGVAKSWSNLASRWWGR